MVSLQAKNFPQQSRHSCDSALDGINIHSIDARRRAFSLTELMAVVAVLGVLATLIVPRVLGHNDTAKKNACYTNKREIELQAKLWRRNNNSYPTANLNTIGADANYFPSGLPTCPLDGTAYTINTTSGLVTGHTH